MTPLKKNLNDFSHLSWVKLIKAYKKAPLLSLIACINNEYAQAEEGLKHRRLGLINLHICALAIECARTHVNLQNVSHLLHVHIGYGLPHDQHQPCLVVVRSVLVSGRHSSPIFYVRGA